MLNIRTATLSLVLVVVLMLTVQLVNARTEVASNPLSAPAIVVDHQDRYDKMSISDPVIVLDHEDRYDQMNKAPIPSYRSSLDECFDVPLRDAAGCRNASQALVPAYRSPIDVCYDMPLSAATACRIAEQADAP